MPAIPTSPLGLPAGLADMVPLLDSAPAVLYSRSAQFPQDFLYVSGNCQVHLGCSASQLQATPSCWHDGVHPEDRAGVDGRLRDLELGHPTELIYRFRTEGGSYRWLRDEVVRVDVGGSGRLVGMVTSLEDRTFGGQPLVAIAGALAGPGRDAFFRTLVRFLSESARVPFAMIGEVSGDNQAVVRPLAVYEGGRYLDAGPYEVAGTPCELVLQGRTEAYSQGVRLLFPASEQFQQMGLDGYLGTPLRDSDGSVIGLMVLGSTGLLLDTASLEAGLRIFAVRAAAELERRRWLRELEESRGLLRTIAATMPTPMFLYNLRTQRHEFVNRAHQNLIGYSLEELAGKSRNLASFVHPDDLPRLFSPEAREVIESGAPLEITYRLRCASGEYRCLRSQIVVTEREESGAPLRILGVAEDETEKRLLAADLDRATSTDPQTGLANRTSFLRAVDGALECFRGDPARRFAVICLDLDRFGAVNDGLGPDAGDRVLAELGRRLQAAGAGRPFARVGGDEFAVLVEPASVEAVESQVQAFQAALGEPVFADGRHVVITASQGAAFCDESHLSGAHVVRDAFIALHRASVRRPSGVEIFSGEMRARARALVEHEEDLRRGVATSELAVFYQPAVHLKTGILASLEALVRWRHPERGLLLPESFLDLAETAGLMGPIDWWVLGSAARTLTGWLTSEALPAGAMLHVNLSRQQVVAPDFVGRFARLLEGLRVSPGRLCLEVTEKILVEAESDLPGKLAALRDLGCQVALDDFGTGYSTLSRLAVLPLDCIKIDRSFITGLATSVTSRRIVQAMIHMAHDLNLKVVAEGVETSRQQDLLREMGCDAGQGLLFGMAVADPLEQHRVSAAASR